MTTFADVLNTKAEEIEKPKPRPLGTYFAVVQGMPKQREFSGRDGTEYITLDYMFKLTGAQQLNDSSAEVGDLSDWAPMSKSFFLNTEEAQWGHKQFLLNALGIDGTGKTVGEMVAEAPGKQVLVKLKHEPYVDKNTQEAMIATRIDSIAKV